MRKDKNTLTLIEQEIEIALWKQSAKALKEGDKSAAREHLKMLEDRKAGKTPLYVSLVSGKAFRWDGSYR